MAALCDVTRNFNISPKVVTTFHYSCLLNITSVFPQRHKVSVLSGGCNQRDKDAVVWRCKEVSGQRTETKIGNILSTSTRYVSFIIHVLFIFNMALSSDCQGPH